MLQGWFVFWNEMPNKGSKDYTLVQDHSRRREPDAASSVQALAEAAAARHFWPQHVRGTAAQLPLWGAQWYVKSRIWVIYSFIYSQNSLASLMLNSVAGLTLWVLTASLLEHFSCQEHRKMNGSLMQKLAFTKSQSVHKKINLRIYLFMCRHKFLNNVFNANNWWHNSLC